jgi:RecA/RadA recombinase
MRGEVIEIAGRLSSGRTSLLTTWLTDVTRRGGLAALVDADGAFDPQSAVRAGVDLRRLLWVRTASRRETALRAVDLLVRCRGLTLVAVDFGESPPRLSLAAAFRWRMAAQRAGTTLVILSARRIAGAGATLAVRTARRALEWSGGPRATRLARMATGVEVLRGRAPAPAEQWWCA